MEPRIQYAKTEDGVNIAYWTYGEGEPPLIMTTSRGLSHITLELDEPALVAWYERLARRRMIVRYDPRGEGLSQRDLDDAAYGLDKARLDVEAVVNGLATDRVNLLGSSGPTYGLVAFAAEHRGFVERLVLDSPTHGSDFEIPAVEGLLELAKRDWRLFTETWAHVFVGWSHPDAAREYARYMRHSTSQDHAIRSFELIPQFDLTPLLPEIESPTLVLNDLRGRLGTMATSQLVVSSVKDGRFVQFDSGRYYTNPAAQRAILEFLGDPSDENASAAEPDVELPEGTAIILFLDIADSTALTTKLGDAAYRERERELDASLRSAITDAGGTPVEGKVLGDGIMSVFTSARQAIDAAVNCRELGNEAGLPLHLGIHAGDVVREGNNVYGGAVQVAARVQSAAEPGEILVSATVRDLGRTSAGAAFEDRGEHELKGIPEPQRLFAVRDRG